MNISKVRVVNYRSCKDIEFNLNRFSIIVGYNNAGKSNALYGIQWLLKPVVLTEKDFNDLEKDIEVYAIIDGLSEDFLGKLAPEHRDRIRPFAISGKLMIKRVLDHTMVSKKGILLYISKDTDKSFSEATWQKNPTGIDNAIQALFPDCITIPAMSDAVEDSTKFASKTTMGQLVSKIIEEFKNKNETKINNSLQIIRDLVCIDGEERSEDLEKIDKLVSKCISEIFPGIGAKLHISLPTIDDIFKGATLKTIEDGNVRDLDSLGHGTQRSIQMALIRSLAEVSGSDEDTSITTILIEEPELYLHPYAIELTRQSLKKLSKSKYQVIIVTHSPLLISSDDFADTLMFRKSSILGTYRLPTIKEKIKQDIVDMPSQAEVIFSLSNKVNILFSERVLLVEGRTEYRVMPKIFEIVKSKTMSAKGIALVPQDGVDNTINSIKILNDMGLKASAIADLDFAFRGAVKNGLIEADNENLLSLKRIMTSIATIKGFLLDESGLPKKGNGFSASDGYSFLGSEPSAFQDIQSIKENLKTKGIWIWDKGCIEDHLGVSGKNETVWASIISKLESKPFDEAVKDYEGFINLINWINE